MKPVFYCFIHFHITLEIPYIFQLEAFLLINSFNNTEHSHQEKNIVNSSGTFSASLFLKMQPHKNAPIAKQNSERALWQNLEMFKQKPLIVYFRH